MATENLSTAPANACQSLAHPTTPMGRWLKSVDCWVLLCEGLQSRSTTTFLAVRLRRSVIPVSPEADLRCRQQQTIPLRGTRGTAFISPPRQSPLPTTTARRSGAPYIPLQTEHDPRNASKRQTAHRPPLPINATHTQNPTLTPLPPPHCQEKNKPPPRPPPIEEEAMEEGDDPNFISDTNEQRHHH
eukprot:scaffold7739_cov127-Isochrysis_galbana.AAC.2